MKKELKILFLQSILIAAVIMISITGLLILNIQRISAQMPVESDVEEKISISYSDNQQGIFVNKSADGIYGVKITKGDRSQTHAISERTSYIPFTMGDGEYRVSVFRKVKNEYIWLESYKCQGFQFDFLAPDIYVDYDPNKICSKNVDEVIKDIKNNYHYSYIKALSVNEAYHPDLENLKSGAGIICSDYAALFAAALRSQGIPCKVCIGFVNKSAHAWNEYYQDGEWHFVDLLEVSDHANYRTLIEA